MAKKGHVDVLTVVLLLGSIVGVYFFLIPAAAQPEYRGGLPIISDPNYFVKALIGEQVVTTTTTAATSTQPYWQTAFLTQTQTQTVSVATTGPGPSGASCQIAVADTDINMGDHLAGQVTSNRASVELIVYGRLVGEPASESVHGITDASGKYYAVSGAINVPGIYQLFAALNFPSPGVEVPCTPIITVTVHGFMIMVNPDSIPASTPSTVTIELYSDRPNAHMTIEWRDDLTPPPPLWAIYAGVTTNAAGHAVLVVPNFLSAHIMNFIFRGHDGNIGDNTVNEEWLAVA